ncbi:MAG: site-specific integrase, partial [Alphaproteobacteria bacterium]|nr:site-specific integrase [Alphaproteobacteria bacterium]
MEEQGHISASQNYTRLIDRFLQTIAAEKAVSKHTLSAYHSDLSVVAAGLANLLSDTAAGGLQPASADDLRKELHLWYKQGLTASTIARRLSVLRHFMSWMVAENHG